MSFKQRLKERIEKNAVVSELSYVDRKGKIITEKVYLKRSKLPLIGDWGRIYPPIDENGKVNLLNVLFGGRKNFIRLLLIMGLLLLFYLEFTSLLGNSREYMNGQKYIVVPRESFNNFCSQEIISELPEKERYNFTELNKLTITQDG